MMDPGVAQKNTRNPTNAIITMLAKSTLPKVSIITEIRICFAQEVEVLNFKQINCVYIFLVQSTIQVIT